MSNLKIKGHTSPGMRKRNVREDYGRKEQARFKVSNGTTVIRCRTRYFEQPPPKRKTSAASATGKDSLENLTKQRIDLVTEQLARDRSNQKSGGSSYRRMRPVGLPEGVAEGRGWGEKVEKSTKLWSIHGRRSLDSEDRRRDRGGGC